MDDPLYREKMRVLSQLYTNFLPNSTCTFYDAIRTPTIIYELLHKQPARIHLRYQVHVRFTYDTCAHTTYQVHNNQPTLLLHAFFFFSVFSTTPIPYGRRVDLLQPPLFQHKSLYLILAFFAFTRSA